MSERWKWVRGYKGLYKVSTHGRVKSYQKQKPYLLKHIINRDGYATVTLYKNGKAKRVFVHMLMLTTFVGPCPVGLRCRHLDDVKLNLVLDNLCWGSMSDNAKDAFRNGKRSHIKYSKGDEHYKAKLSWKKIRQARRIWDANKQKFGLCQRLAGRFGVTYNTMAFVLKNQTWKDPKWDPKIPNDLRFAKGKARRCNKTPIGTSARKRTRGSSHN